MQERCVWMLTVESGRCADMRVKPSWSGHESLSYLCVYCLGMSSERMECATSIDGQVNVKLGISMATIPFFCLELLETSVSPNRFAEIRLNVYTPNMSVHRLILETTKILHFCSEYVILPGDHDFRVEHSVNQQNRHRNCFET